MRKTNAQRRAEFFEAYKAYNEAGCRVAELAAKLPKIPKRLAAEGFVIEVGYEQWCDLEVNDEGARGSTDGWDDMSEGGQASFVLIGDKTTLDGEYYAVPEDIEWN